MGCIFQVLPQTGDSGHAAVRHPETTNMRHSSQTGDRHRRGVECWRYRAWHIERRSQSPLCGRPAPLGAHRVFEAAVMPQGCGTLRP